MHPRSLEARNKDERPFLGMKISNGDILNDLDGRSSCTSCGKSRMYFCYNCYVPVLQLKDRVPVCKLPFKVDIIKHRREIDGKSTAAHAAVLAPNDVNVYIYPDMPDYILDGRIVLLYPGAEAKTVQELFTGHCNSRSYSEKVLASLPSGYNVGTLMTKLFIEDHNAFNIFHFDRLPIDRVVLIDSTWNQSKGIYADERFQKIPKIVLQNRPSQFWRHQKGSPRWYLSTIEALHQLLLEVHISAWGCSKDYNTDIVANYPRHSSENHSQCTPYIGQYDDLLFFFKFMYEKLHKLFKHEDLLAYKRPML